MGQLINDFVGNFNICEFNVDADENSQFETVDIDIGQTNEAFIFTPKTRALVPAKVSVSLENNALKFLTELKDISKSRIVKIPVPISPSQVVVTPSENNIGMKITVHKKPNITEHQPDFAVHVNQQ